MAEYFALTVDKRLAAFWLPIGVRAGRDGVTITDGGTFLPTFGFETGDTARQDPAALDVSEVA